MSFELGYSCSGGTRFTSDVCTEACGDTYITASEQCEDGNTASGDGCFNCLTEFGWQCSSSNK